MEYPVIETGNVETGESVVAPQEPTYQMVTVEVIIPSFRKLKQGTKLSCLYDQTVQNFIDLGFIAIFKTWEVKLEEAQLKLHTLDAKTMCRGCHGYTE